MFLLALEFEFWVGKQMSILCMLQVILTSVFVKGRIIDTYGERFFAGSRKVVPLLAYYVEVFH